MSAGTARVRLTIPEGVDPGAVTGASTAVLEFGNRGTLGSFHRVIVDDAGTDRTGQLVRVKITGMDDRGLLHASMGECDL